MTAGTIEIPSHALPAAFLASGPTSQVKYGVPAWWVYHYDECDYDEIFVHTHDQRRGAAAISAMIRDADGAAERRRAKVAETGWCRLVDQCGCTPAQHAAHVDAEIGECVGCQRPDLPPCDGDAIYVWQVDAVPEGTEGALPFMRVELT